MDVTLVIALLIANIAPGLVSMALVQLWAERRWAAQPPRPQTDRSNLKVWGAALATQTLLGPGFGAIITLGANRLGGGWIVLPSTGWGLIFGAAVYFVAMDLGEYIFHRAQHAFPWLWALHSLHHSDTSFDVTTTVRHFWLDPFLKSVSVWLAVGLLFRASGAITLIYAAICLYNYVIHSNTRLDLGRWAWALNHPAYHRIHHSAAPEHFDVNFAAILPVFDVVCGTYLPAKPGSGRSRGSTPGVWPAPGGTPSPGPSPISCDVDPRFGPLERLKA